MSQQTLSVVRAQAPASTTSPHPGTAARARHFYEHWHKLNARMRRKLVDFARYPTERNECYFVGYLAALEDHMLLAPDTAVYMLSLAGSLRETAWIREIVLEAKE